MNMGNHETDKLFPGMGDPYIDYAPIEASPLRVAWYWCLASGVAGIALGFFMCAAFFCECLCV